MIAFYILLACVANADFTQSDQCQSCGQSHCVTAESHSSNNLSETDNFCVNLDQIQAFYDDEDICGKQVVEMAAIVSSKIQINKFPFHHICHYTINTDPSKLVAMTLKSE